MSMKKIRKTRFIAVLCIMVFGVCAFGGCGKKESSTTNSQEMAEKKENAVTNEATPSQTEEKSEPVKIRIFNRLNPEVNVENNPVLDKLEEELNVEIEYEAPPINNYNEKLQITMASGELPDIIYNWGGADLNYDTWAKNGLLAELDDYIGNYPNIMATVPEGYWDTFRSVETGKIHAIPRTNVDNYWGFIINQTWLDNLGLKAPTTLQEFKDVCHAFTYDDPDQNGKDDTFGFSFSITGSDINVQALRYAFGIADVKDSDGEYATITRRTGYIPYLTFLRELYEDGSLDPEFFTNATYAHEEKLTAGKVGITTGHQVDVLGFSPTVPDAINRFTYIGAPEDLNGVRTEYIAQSYWGGWMISADADVEAALKLIDYCMSEEGFTMMFLGMEGEHYNSYDYETRMVDRTDEQTAALTNVASSYFTFAFAKDGASAIIENANTQEALDKYYNDFNTMKDATTAVRVPTIKSPEMTAFQTNNPDLISKLSELEIQYVVGEIEEDELTDFLAKEYYPASETAEKEYVSLMKSFE